MQLDMAGRSKNFLIDMKAAYSALTSYSGAFPHNLYHLGCHRKKQLLKDSSRHFSVAGMDSIFSPIPGGP